jgi:Fe2+ transport system protein A
MPLTLAQPGIPVQIQRITGKDETKRFLGNLGFVQGESVTVISAFDGNLILNVKDTRIALSQQMAKRIMV